MLLQLLFHYSASSNVIYTKSSYFKGISLIIFKVSQLLKKGEIKATELCKMCLQRLKNVKSLNAFITETPDVATEQSKLAQKRIDKGTPLGVLDGIPVAFKDNFNTRQVRTTCASIMLENYISPYNATVVQRLFDAGTVMVGKTNLDEFAMGSATVDSHFGPTKNPWRSGFRYSLSRLSESQLVKELSSRGTEKLTDNDFFVPGGSSGGSAVAVATGTCFGALGSDTGGSTRNPAALCGIVGLKPSYGLVSRNGLVPLCNSLDVPGVLARSVDDATLLLNSIAGHDWQDSTTVIKEFKPICLEDDVTIKGLHIGIPKEYECPRMSSEVISTWKAAADTLERAGARVSMVSLPHTQYSIVCYSILCCCDVASNFACYDGVKYGHRATGNTAHVHHYAMTRQEGFGEVVRERILAGNYYLLKKNYKDYFVKAAKVRKLICDDFQNVFDRGIDLLLTPVTLTDPIPYSQWILTDNREHNAVQDYCTQPVNLAGLPAVSIPCKLSQQALPISLQLVGKAFRERQMLIAAKWIEQQMDFPRFHLEC